MYDIRKRSAFQTVGELRALLNCLPANTKVCICGDASCFFHEEHDGSLISFDYEDLNYHYEEALEEMLAAGTAAERDVHLETFWAEFADVPMDPNTECIEATFYTFPAGTHREDIWRWFDERHSKGVAYLLNGPSPSNVPQEDALTQFLKQEVLCRLLEILEIPEELVTESLVHVCVDALNNGSEFMFDHDWIDDRLLEVLKEHGVSLEDV